VAAAVLSTRYISDRFLPDKAIDLVDEAAAKLKMEITSKPEELDEVDRKILQLEMERLSLKNETDAASMDRLERLEKELADLKETQSGLNAQWQSEKDLIDDIQKLREELDQVNIEIQQAERNYDLNRAAELKYGKLTDLQRQLEDAEQNSGKRPDHWPIPIAGRGHRRRHRRDHLQMDRHPRQQAGGVGNGETAAPRTGAAPAGDRPG
jgi:ATP-dependent Clp protease ATP-binding subunit ClpB